MASSTIEWPDTFGTAAATETEVSSTAKANINNNSEDTSSHDMKRRKVSLSPTPVSTSTSRSTRSRRKSTNGEEVVVDDTIYKGFIEDQSSKDDMEILVEGCGVNEVNGTYKRAPKYDTLLGTPYMKEGSWTNGGTSYSGTYVLYNDGINKNTAWHIGLWKSPHYPTVYYTSVKSSKNKALPPSGGWNTMNAGRDPAPKLYMHE